jgi:hypothetical protein
MLFLYLFSISCYFYISFSISCYFFCFCSCSLTHASSAESSASDPDAFAFHSSFSSSSTSSRQMRPSSLVTSRPVISGLSAFTSARFSFDHRRNEFAPFFGLSSSEVAFFPFAGFSAFDLPFFGALPPTSSAAIASARSKSYFTERAFTIV